MIIGSHNSWSYLTPKKWWMRLTFFMSRCQRYNIKEQYNRYGVRCFDLRIRFKGEKPIVCHGVTEYKYDYEDLIEDLKWLHSRGDVIIRLALELRGVKKKNWHTQKVSFNTFYLNILEVFYPNITFVLGRSIPDWEKIIKNIPEGSIKEDYASVSNPKYLDDWIPILYAMWHNKIARNISSSKEVLLLDFVDIY